MSSPPPKPSAIADPGSGPGQAELIGAIGADRALALQHLPAEARPAVEALFRLDSAMGDVVARAREPMLARIKLAWWREQLENLDDVAPPAEPRLEAVARQLLPKAITGAQLAELEAGWSALLDEPVEAEIVGRRGSALFALAARLLGGTDPKLGEAGSLHALASVGRRGLPELLEPAAVHRDRLRGHRFPARLRGLTLLARVATRDLGGPPFEAEASPSRALAMLAHRWSGRIA